MDWFIDDPRRGQIALTIIVLLLAGAIVWFGRRKLLLAVPVSLVFLLLAATALPSAVPARLAAQRNACIFNLRTIQDAKTEWAGKNNKLPVDVPAEAQLYGTNGILRLSPICPRGGIYTIGSVSQNPTCTLSNKGHLLQ